MPQQRRVAITGMGVITPLGIGVDALWDGLMESRSAVKPPRSFDAGDMPSTHIGEMPEIDFDAYLDARASAFWGRASKISVVAAKMAFEDAGGPEFAPTRLGTIFGTGYGGLGEMEQAYITWVGRGWKRLKPVTVPRSMPNAPASLVAIAAGARGINFSVSTACSSGAIAAGLAAQQIRSGALDACITGGVDSTAHASLLGAWCALRVLARRRAPDASRPFSADRDGLVFAEGCAVLLLEEMEAARARGARIHAELRGIGATNDAVSVVGPDAVGELEAMQMAVADAGLKPEDIGYVSAHGTSTKANDANETRVLKEFFGERAYKIPTSSIKGNIGHTMGASGAIEIASTARALTHQRVPPTLHYVGGDEACDLDYVAEGPRDVAFEHAITNCFGFGGQNSVLVLSRV